MILGLSGIPIVAVPVGGKDVQIRYLLFDLDGSLVPIAPSGQFINSEYLPSVALVVSIDFFDCLFAMTFVYYSGWCCFVFSLVVGLWFAKYRRCLRMNFPHKSLTIPNKHLVNFIFNFRPVVCLGAIWFSRCLSCTSEQTDTVWSQNIVFIYYVFYSYISL